MPFTGDQVGLLRARPGRPKRQLAFELARLAPFSLIEYRNSRGVIRAQPDQSPGPSSIHLDPESKDAARRRDLVRLWTAVPDIRINAPGVDRQRFAVGTDLKDDVIERVRRKEVHGLARCIGFRIAFAKNLFEAGEVRLQPDRLDMHRA